MDNNHGGRLVLHLGIDDGAIYVAVVVIDAQPSVEPRRTAFLDDIGRNLKSARALGMATIKVDDPEAALRELGALLGFDLLG